MRISSATRLAASLALAASLLAACGNSDADSEESSASEDETLVIYSGRNEDLVSPLIDKLESAIGADVEVRYGDTAELGAQLMEEGDRSEADLFFSQDAGALGALGRAGMLKELPADVLAPANEEFRDDDNLWVATSARARVLVYNTEQVPEVTSFTAIDDILSQKYEGKIGYAPTNASFQSFVTALRVMKGEKAAEKWLTDFAELDPVAYDKNGTVLEAVNKGDVSIGLINHYYWYPLAAELGEDAMEARIHFLDSDDPGALINVAGVGVLATSEQAQLAEAAVSFLLSDEAQQYFADETAEYPVVEGITSTTFDTGSLADLHGAQLDLNDLDSLEDTQALLSKVGLI